MNEASFNFCTENYSPFLMKMQKPKDAFETTPELCPAKCDVDSHQIKLISNFCQLRSSLH